MTVLVVLVVMVQEVYNKVPVKKDHFSILLISCIYFIYVRLLGVYVGITGGYCNISDSFCSGLLMKC